MSAGYPAGAGQALDVASATAKAKLGDIFAFKTTNGTVWAQYIKASATISQGRMATWDGLTEFGVNTAQLGTGGPPSAMAGIAQGALDTDTPYGWVAFRGAVPYSLLAASLATAATPLYHSINVSGNLASHASTISATEGGRNAMIFPVRATAATAASSSATAGHVVDLFLR